MKQSQKVILSKGHLEFKPKIVPLGDDTHYVYAMADDVGKSDQRCWVINGPRNGHLRSASLHEDSFHFFFLQS